jgi:hypothetical protein
MAKADSRQAWAGYLAQTNSIASVVSMTGLTRSQVSYWREKVADPTFHPGTYGGPRNWKFQFLHHALIEAILLEIVKAKPLETVFNYCKELEGYGIFGVLESWVTRVLTRWNFSTQKVYQIQKAKFSTLNMLRYVDHIYGMHMLHCCMIR